MSPPRLPLRIDPRLNPRCAPCELEPLVVVGETEAGDDWDAAQGGDRAAVGTLRGGWQGIWQDQRCLAFVGENVREAPRVILE